MAQQMLSNKLEDEKNMNSWNQKFCIIVLSYDH